jgi:hypothetical protein
MTQDDVIRWAREARLDEPSHPMNPWGASAEGLERFAKLVAAAQREESAELAQEMIDVEYMLDDFAKSIRIGMRRMCDDGRPKWLKDSMQVAAEREACAKVCDGWTHADGDICAAAIRARGEV